MTTGTENITDIGMDYREKVEGKKPRNRRTHYKMKVRLTFDIPETEMLQLQPFTEYCDRMPHGKVFAKWTGVSCYIDMETADKKQIKAAMKTLSTKEKTLWISFLPVTANFITAVELRRASGAYHPYDFEKFIRPTMGELGFFFPSQGAMSELQIIVKPLPPSVTRRHHCLKQVYAVHFAGKLFGNLFHCQPLFST